MMTPPCFEVPAILACRITSPDRSTPGPLPYHRPKTPSYLPSPRNSACWDPQIAVAARSSFKPSWNTISDAANSLAARRIWKSTAPKGDPRYPVQNPAVFNPDCTSRAFCANIKRINAWVPFNRTVFLDKSYLSDKEMLCTVIIVPPVFYSD